MKAAIFAPWSRVHIDKLSVFPPFSGVFVVLAASLLGGCVDTLATQQPQPAPVLRAPGLARQDGVSPSGASLAVVSLSGLPQSLSAPFETAFASAMKDQDMTMADSKRANYLVRGYLSAAPVQKGTAIAVVWDVFDAKKRRTQRLDDTVMIAAKSAPQPTDGDPWALVGQAALERIATQSADDLAAFLTNTPEALAASTSAAGSAMAAKTRNPPDGQTSVAETPLVPATSAPNPSPARGFAALR